MQVDTLPRRPVENWEAERDEWVAAVERIADDDWEMLDGIIVVRKAAVLPDGWRR